MAFDAAIETFLKVHLFESNFFLRQEFSNVPSSSSVFPMSSKRFTLSIF